MNGLSTGESVFFSALFVCAALVASFALADSLFVPSLTAGVASGGPIATAVLSFLS